jgi:hypothetical protein
MAEGIGATKAVPALNAFLQLCQGARPCLLNATATSLPLSIT